MVEEKVGVSVPIETECEGNIMKKNLENVGKRVLIMHFADLVKYYATQYFNWNGEKDEVGRSLLQEIGTTVMRGRYPTYWAEIIGKFIDAYTIPEHSFFDYILIPDWRFINEYEVVYDYAAIQNNETITIRVVRYNENGLDWKNPNMTSDQLKHISECELDNFAFNWIIENRRGIKDLEGSVDEIMKEEHFYE